MNIEINEREKTLLVLSLDAMLNLSLILMSFAKEVPASAEYEDKIKESEDNIKGFRDIKARLEALR